VREARTIVDAFKAKTPWLSETLLPKRDIWGEPIPLRDALGAAGLTAIYDSRADADPIASTMERLGMGMTTVPRTIRGVTLTDAQHDDFARLAGRMARTQLNQIVTPGFDRLPAFAQREIIATVVKHTRESARGLVMIQNPSIIEAGIRNKLEVIEGAKPVRPIKQ